MTDTSKLGIAGVGQWVDGPTINLNQGLGELLWSAITRHRDRLAIEAERRLSAS
jgi:hypothetical protein